MNCIYGSMDMISEDWQPRILDISDYINAGKGIRVSMLRLDEIHPVISGNKWFKLKKNISVALQQGIQTIVTFGGAYSNHLIAAAATAQQYGLKSIGIVRGDVEYSSNPTLSACRASGMELIFVSREEYKYKNEPYFVESILPQTSRYFIIPEGGSNEWGREGAGDITEWLPDDITHVSIPVGTGTTIAGILNKGPLFTTLGFCATKECHEQMGSIETWVSNKGSSLMLYKEEHFGGFGKWSNTLVEYIRQFHKATAIPLDVIYTGKMMYSLGQLIYKGLIPAEANIICIHTGGLQGNPIGLFAT